jgi:hypothetical protein
MIKFAVREARLRYVIHYIHKLRQHGLEAQACVLDLEAPTALENCTYVIDLEEDLEYAEELDTWVWSDSKKPYPLNSALHEILKLNSRDSSVSCFIVGEAGAAKASGISGTVVDSYAKVYEALVADLQPRPPLPSLPSLATRIVCIRHAQRLDEVLPQWHLLAARPQDTPLSALGHDQARSLGSFLSVQTNWLQNLGGVYCSPFCRVVQTAAGAWNASGWAADDTQQKARDGGGHGSSGDERSSRFLNIEYGLAEGASWFGQGDGSRVQTPWYLEAADLMHQVRPLARPWSCMHYIF